MSNLTFFGASGIVTGSCFLLQQDSDSFLIDLGMYQESSDIQSENTKPLPFDPTSLNCVFITHAHLDHCGRLPLLAKAGYRGPIYMTPATKDIVEISLDDSARLAERKEEEDGIPALYTSDDVLKVLDLIQTVEYDTPFTHGSANIVFKDAGHILGSAIVEITDKIGKKTVFSGDLGNFPEDIIKPTEFISDASTVVIESTYGGETHKHEDVYEILQHEINEISNTNGVLLIPAFSIQRTQELIHRIGHLLKDKKISADIPIYVDSPMAIKVTEVFKKYTNLYNSHTASDETPFEFDTLILTEEAHQSKEILKVDGPKVVIAGSGMMSGGRIQYHLKNYISSYNTRILIVGYQAENTLGRQIETGVKRITLFEEDIPIHATITKIESMSSHADHPKLMKWLHTIKGLENVCIVHGEDDRRQALADAIKNDFPNVQIHLPTPTQTIEY